MAKKMVKEMKKGMKSATMPKEHFERNYNNLETCRAKYAGEFSNPEDLEKSNNALADYVKKNRMKY